MLYLRLAACTLSLTALAGCLDDPEPTNGLPLVGSSSDLTAFQGARAGQAEQGIQRLGYKPVRVDGLTAWWFNSETGACARITTADGRYSSVVMLPAEDC